MSKNISAKIKLNKYKTRLNKLSKFRKIKSLGTLPNKLNKTFSQNSSRRNFSSDLNLNSSSNSILKTTHPELFFFTDQIMTFEFSKIDSEEEFKLRKEKLLEEIIPPIISKVKIPESGRSLLANELEMELEFWIQNFSFSFNGKNLAERIPPGEIKSTRDLFTIHIFISLSLLLSQNYKEIFFPKKNREEIEKDIERGVQEVVNYILKKVSSSSSSDSLEEKKFHGVIQENFISISFSTFGKNSGLVLDEVSEYFTELFSRNFPLEELIKIAIMDMKEAFFVGKKHQNK